MTIDTDFEQLVAGAFAQSAPTEAPGTLIARVLTATVSTRRRPAWLARMTEDPLRLYTRVVVGSPVARGAYLLSVGLLAAMLAIGGVVGGALLLTGRSIAPPPLPAVSPDHTPSTQPTPPGESPAPSASVRPPESPGATPASGCCIGNPNYFPGFGWGQLDEWSDESGLKAYVFTKLGRPAAGTTVVVHWGAELSSPGSACGGDPWPNGPSTVDDMIAALLADRRLSASAPVQVSLTNDDGQTYEGLMVDIELAPDWNANCSDLIGEFSSAAAAALFAEDGEELGPRYAVVGSEMVRVTLIDVDTVVVAILVHATKPSRFDASVGAAASLADTFNFQSWR